MAVIPEFQQQRLASAAVGTPGVDRSAGSAAGQLARFSSGIVEQVGQLAIEKRRALDTISAGEANSRLKITNDNIINEGKKEFELDPDSGTEIINNRLDNAFNVEMKLMNSTRLQQQFAARGQTSRTNSKITYNNFRNDQNLINAENKINQTLVNHNQRLFNAGQAGDTSILFDIMEGDIPESVNDLTNVLGPTKTKTTMTAALSDGMSAYFNGLLQSQPEQVEQLLQSGFIDKFLSTDEQKNFSADAKVKFKAKRKVELSDQTLELINQNQGIWQKFLADDLSIEEIDTAMAATDFAIDAMGIRLQQSPADPASLRMLQRIQSIDKFLPIMRDIALNDNPLDEGEVDERYEEIILAIDKARLKKGLSGQRIAPGADAEDLLRLQSLIVQGKLDEVITKDQAKGFMKQVVTPLAEKLGKAKGKKTGFIGSGLVGIKRESITAFDAVLDNVTTFVRGTGFDKEQKTELKVAMMKKAFKILELTKIEDIDQARVIANQLIKETLIRLNPSLGLLPQTPNAIMTSSGTLNNILPGKSRATPSKKITEKGQLIRQKSTGKWFIRPNDGSSNVEITDEQAQRFIDNGGT